MQYKLGSDAFDRKFEREETITVREDIAIITALNEILGSKDFQELWQADGINTEAVQSVIDDNIRVFLENYKDKALTKDD